MGKHKSKKNQVKELLEPLCNGQSDNLAQAIDSIYQKKKNISDSALHNHCKDWFIQYCTDNEFENYWTAQHSIALNHLCKKLKFSYEKKWGVSTDDDVFNSFCFFITHLPDWHKQRLSLKTLNNNFDSVINEIKFSNGKPKFTGKQPFAGHSAEVLAEAVRRATSKT